MYQLLILILRNCLYFLWFVTRWYLKLKFVLNSFWTNFFKSCHCVGCATALCYIVESMQLALTKSIDPKLGGKWEEIEGEGGGKGWGGRGVLKLAFKTRRPGCKNDRGDCEAVSFLTTCKITNFYFLMTEEAFVCLWYTVCR